MVGMVTRYEMEIGRKSGAASNWTDLNGHKQTQGGLGPPEETAEMVIHWLTKETPRASSHAPASTNPTPRKGRTNFSF